MATKTIPSPGSGKGKSVPVQPNVRPEARPDVRPEAQTEHRDHAGFRQAGFLSPEGEKALEDWYQNVRDARGPIWEECYVETEWGHTRVASAGKSSGPHLVFVHGWSGNAMIWEISGGLHPLMERYRIHLINVNGQPNGSSCLAPKVRDLSYGRWLAQVADGLGVDRAYWVGMSFGGFILARLAEWGPERMLGSALLAPAGMVRLSLRPLWNSDGLLRGFLDARFGQDADAVHRFVHRQLMGPDHGFTKAQVKHLERLFAITFRDFRPGAWPPYKLSNASWYAMTCPSMVLVGSHDRLFGGKALIKRARKVLPDLRVAELLEGQGHAVGNAGLVAKRIGAFFDTLENAPTKCNRKGARKSSSQREAQLNGCPNAKEASAKAKRGKEISRVVAVGYVLISGNQNLIEPVVVQVKADPVVFVRGCYLYFPSLEAAAADVFGFDQLPAEPGRCAIADLIQESFGTFGQRWRIGADADQESAV